MPISTRSNQKRSLAEADANAETAPQKKTSARASKKKNESQNYMSDSEQPKEKCDGCGKECPCGELVTSPITKSKLSAKGRGNKAGGSKKAPMLIAKSGADAHNVIKEAKEKEKAENKEAKEIEKAEKKAIQEKEKAEKKEAKEKEKVGKKASEKEKDKGSKSKEGDKGSSENEDGAKLKDKSTKSAKNGKKPSSSAKDGRENFNKIENGEQASEISRVKAAGKGKERMTPLSAELRAEVEQQRNAVAARVTDQDEANATNTSSGKTAGGGKRKKSTGAGNKENRDQPATNSSQGPSQPSGPATNTSNRTSGAHELTEWVCGCRPIFDVEAEYEDEEEAEDVITCGTEKCICDKPADEYSGHIWIFTKAGKEAFMGWFEEQLKRDQDEHGLHVYNDFSGYGTTEVMENQLIQFDKEFKKKTKSTVALWSQIEGISLFLNGDLDAWQMSDDPERNAQIVALYGMALLSTIVVLIEQQLFKNDSNIKNLGLILSLFVKFTAENCEDICQNGEQDWRKQVLKLAEKHGVELKGPYDMEELLQGIKDEMEEEGASEDEWEDLHQCDWKKEFITYSRKYRPIGGTKYDITKMSKQQRQKYDLARPESP